MSIVFSIVTSLPLGFAGSTLAESHTPTESTRLKKKHTPSSTYALILANGEAPSKRLIQTLRKNASIFVCADGGANIAARLNLRPDIIIGDLDSVFATTRERFPHAKKIQVSDQNFTDLEKAITYLIDHGQSNIIVAGGVGKRLDHTMGNVGALAKFSDRASISFESDDGSLRYVGRKSEFEYEVGSTVSLIPLTHCDGITTSGLQYPLTNESLELGVRDGTSNRVTASPISVTVQSGNLLIYLRNETLPSS